MSNEAKMSLEEKIVQRLKDDTLMMAVGDEDMLTDLVKRAVHESLFQRKRIKEGGYNGKSYDEDSLVVQVAKEVIRPVCENVAKDMVTKVLESQEVKEAINEAMPRMIFDAMTNRAHTAVSNIADACSWDAQNKVLEAIKNNQI